MIFFCEKIKMSKTCEDKLRRLMGGNNLGKATHEIFEKFILDELKSIKNHNCKTYEKTFGKERSFKMTSEKS